MYNEIADSTIVVSWWDVNEWELGATTNCQARSYSKNLLKKGIGHKLGFVQFVSRTLSINGLTANAYQEIQWQYLSYSLKISPYHVRRPLLLVHNLDTHKNIYQNRGRIVVWYCRILLDSWVVDRYVKRKVRQVKGCHGLLWLAILWASIYVQFIFRFTIESQNGNCLGLKAWKNYLL